MVDPNDQRFFNKNTDPLNNPLFRRWSLEYNDLFSQAAKHAPPPKQQRIPKWFINIPKNAKKWICTLHSNIDFIGQNLDSPRNHNCCPHTLETIHPNQQFIVIWHNNHELIKPFEREIAELIGTVEDPNGYLFASSDIKDPTFLIVQKMRDHQILQLITTAIKQAHKSGFVGSFKRYDEIILQLAQQAGNLLTESHNKIFDRYEKCRNLALATPEMGERHTAALMAYEQGRKLVDQLMEALKPPPTPMDDFTEFLQRHWFRAYGVEGDCYYCNQYTKQLYKSLSSWTHSCLDCIKGKWELSHMGQPKGNQLRCQRCGWGSNLKLNNSTGDILCFKCLKDIQQNNQQRSPSLWHDWRP